MFKRSFLLIAGIFLFIPSVSAADIQFNQEYYLSEDQTIQDNLIVAGGNVTINGTVMGDLIAAGGNIYLNGHVTGDVITAGGNIIISKKAIIGKNLRLAGGRLDLDGETAGGGQIAAGEVTIRGHIVGDTKVDAATLNIVGTVDGNVTARVGTLLAGPMTVIGGELSYPEAVPFVQPATSKISKVTKIPTSLERRRDDFFLSMGALKNQFLSYLGSMIIGLLLVMLCGQFVTSTVQHFEEKFWSSLGWGFLMTVASAILSVVALITVIGIPFALVLMGLTWLSIFLGHLFVGIWLGSRILKLDMTAHHEQRRRLLALLIGLAIYKFVTMIPVLGGLISVLSAFSGVGILWLMFRASRASSGGKGLFGWMKS